MITWNGNGWDLTFKNGTVYTFPESSGVPVGGTRSAITKMKDRYGNAITMTRELGTGILQKLTSPNGRWISFNYDSSNRITQAQDNGGRTYSYQYDEGGRLVQVTDPMNGITQYTYDANNQMTSMIDPRNNTGLMNEYNSEGRILRQTAADGGVQQFGYTEDVNGNITQTDVTNPRGFVTRYTYDSDGYFSGGNVLTETRALGVPEQQVYTYQHQPGSNLVTGITDALNRTTSHTYDGKGNLLSVTRLSGTPDAVITSMTYDPTFNVVNSITDPVNHTTQLTVDPSTGNVTAITDPLNNQTTMTHNTSGQLTSFTTTPAGTVQIQYLLTGEISALLDPMGNRQSRVVDSIGRLVSVTDAIGNSIGYQYDQSSRVTRLTDPLQAATQFSYDENSNLGSITDARTGITSYTYDNKDRLIKHTDQLLALETFAYDTNDNPISVTDRKTQVTSTTYDALDRPKIITHADNSTITFTHDGGNRPTQLSDSLAGVIVLTYDMLDRLTSESSPNGTVSYTYDAAGRRFTMSVTGQPIVNYGYDNANRLTQISQGTSSVNITYDTASRRSTVTLPNGVLITYGYDGAFRLNSLVYTKGINLIGNLTYVYDASGRRIQMGGSLARSGLPQAVASASYNAANRLTQWNGMNLTFDANGNTTSDGTNTYTWDARNHLSSIAGTGLAASFGYDALGRRLSKTMNTLTTGFLYDLLNVAQELSGGSPIANSLTGAGVDETFTRTDSTGTANFMADGLNSTLALLDQSGATVTQYTYEPFGDVTATGGTNGNAFQYTGRENDGTGLYYYRARYYSPTTQRFISEDPIGFAGGVNFYTYALVSPTNYIDPLGLDADPAEKINSLWDVIQEHLDKIKQNPNSPWADKWQKDINRAVRQIEEVAKRVCKKRRDGALDKFLQRILGMSLSDLQKLLRTPILIINACLLNPRLAGCSCNRCEA